MTWQETRETTTQSLTAVLDELTEINADDLVRTTALGTELDFSAGVPIFQQTISLLRQLSEADLSSWPTPKIDEIKQVCDQVRDCLHAIRDFSPNQSDPKRARDDLIVNLESVLDNYFLLLTSAAVSSSRDDATVRKQKERITQIVQSAEELHKEAGRRVKETDERSERILDRAHKTAGAVGVVTHAEHFQKEADRSQKSARQWLIATGVLALIAAGISVWTFYRSLSGSSNWITVAQVIFGRFSLMALAYYAAIWSSRMYRAARHNEVVNRHRVNAMRTFDTFAAAGRDDAAKDAILMRATECIFHHQSSGFSDRTPDQGAPKIVNALPTTSPVSGTSPPRSASPDSAP